MATNTDTNESQTSPDPNGTKICYRCGTRIAADATVCSNCGRKQLRTCYCGNSIPVTAPECPYCGADWSGSSRVRRKRRSRSVKLASLARAAGIGAVASLTVMFVGNLIVSYLAGLSHAPEAGAAGYPDKLGYAYDGLARSITHIWQSLGSHSGSVAVVGIGLVLGAILGSVIYMIRIGAIRLTKKNDRRRRSSK